MRGKKDFVVRISAKNYGRIKELIEHSEEKLTLNQITEKMLDAMDVITGGQIVYVVGHRLFDDLAEARGEAIVQAVKDKVPPVWPRLFVSIGDDKGA